MRFVRSFYGFETDLRKKNKCEKNINIYILYNIFEVPFGLVLFIC